MITNFPLETAELTPEEKKLVPLLIQGFSTHGKNNPIKEPAIIKAINDNKEKFGLKKKLSGSRLRKLCNFIRRNGMIPLIGTSRGYYVSNDKEEIAKQITSLEERAAGILTGANGLKKFL